MAFFATIIQSSSAVSVILALSYSLYAIKFWPRIPFPANPPESESEDLPTMALVIPTWNESPIIESKLDDIASQNYPPEKIKVIVIDAASQDGTIEKVESWWEKNSASSPFEFEIIREEERKGKSVSINLAFENAKQSYEVMTMSDVDCRLDPGSLVRLGKWFLDPTIGAVTGRQRLVIIGESIETQNEKAYRSFYRKLRTSETHLDSTAMFDGGLSAYRSSCLVDFSLVEDANSDDSQMAVAVRRTGMKSIYDDNLVFIEMAANDSQSLDVQKVRRSQGIIRHFFRSRDILWDSNFNDFRKVIFLGIVLHILLPWFVALGFLSGLSSMIHVVPNLVTGESQTNDFHDLVIMFIIIDLIVIILLFSGRFNLRIPFGRLAFSFLTYQVILLKAQILIGRGRSLHRWEQVKSVRESLQIYDEQN